MSEERNRVELSEIIAENFGANATYVEGLLNRYRSNPSLVDEAWRAYFAELLGEDAGDGAGASAGGNGSAATTASAWPGSADGGQTSQPPQASETQTATAEATAQETPAQPSASAQQPAAQAAPSTATQASAPAQSRGESQPIRGAALKIVENMETSLGVPTATSNRQVPVKVLEENRALVNQFLKEHKRGKTSYTHFIAFALLRALERFPQLNDGFAVTGGHPTRVKRAEVNLGVAIDLEKKDGTRTLLVPNVKNAGALQFADFLKAYDDVIKRAREGKLAVADFQDTTVSLTNPGTIGTVSSNPRLMAGQSAIIATGAIEYPAEYHAMTPKALSLLGISKVINVSSTYDHRIVQGAESGGFLAHVHELLLGEHDFYLKIFRDLGIPYQPMRWSKDFNPALLGRYDEREEVEKEARVLELINAYRVRGHLIADIDPLNAMPVQYHPELDIETYGLTIWDLDREFITGGLGGKHNATLREILDILRRAYCGKVGTEYRHIQSKEQKVWIRERIRQEFVNPEPLDVETKKALLGRLTRAEQFERFLHTKYLGQKRFSLEGCETVISLLDQLVERSADKGVEEITLGMAHRGRLNVLANVVGNFSERIFTAFEGSVHPDFPADEGDVKYHQGAAGERETASGKKVKITISPNPSHLEFVDPVVEGMVRARQDALEFAGSKREEVIDCVLPVLLHGDAAFAGQGIVMETLQLAGLHGYGTGGTIHIIINNQIGFTTSPEASRSSIYSTDVAKMTQLPIFHINGDDPEAAFRVLRMALDFRQEFNKDVVLDLIGFRRLGHNEGDEPSYTQPLMYARVKAHPGVRTVYAQRLLAEGAVTEEEVEQMQREAVERYERFHARAKEIVAQKAPVKELPAEIQEEDGSDVLETPVGAGTIRDIAHRIAVVPEGFNINPKMVSQLARRAKMGEGQAPIDWGFAELMAFGSLGLEGTRVRLSGQDSGRGTFSHRHSIMYDTRTGKPWAPLSEMTARDGRALVEVFDSSLSEQG
ncbi:MAG TPA: multifunctional oxoglutarate decarboxylase/oxoglutarate dehydrogenase thiamine pyrophosphate-binding subunit/dihydrolipoyllysine-residue succinyltransferase subunit, partial [Pyrinomonadaceae bacterium]|nr:multifunctional oxoglutarate decarboxylase/oxoglutarate dehydrogenase thiamine pyrophosphate-binding subunit/dihydrolipoyllysine-residue succinyltransferase subunit [Pyrinomonadaceae bacterium]